MGLTVVSRALAECGGYDIRGTLLGPQVGFWVDLSRDVRAQGARGPLAFQVEARRRGLWLQGMLKLRQASSKPVGPHDVAKRVARAMQMYHVTYAQAS